MNEFFTWTTLGTYAGMVLATGMLTQFLKDAFKQLPTRILSYVVALVLLFAVDAVSGVFTLESAGLAIINATVIAFAASGGFDAIKSLNTKK